MANGLPAFEVPQPVLGQSAVPLGRLDEFVVPVEEELPAIAMPDIAAAPELIPLPFEVPEPAAVTSGLAEDFEVAPVDVPDEIAFEAQPASPRAELAAGVSPEFEEQQFAVQTLSEQEDQLRNRGQELAFALGSEKDPAKRAEREQEAEDNIAASQANQQQLGMARGMRDRTQAVETARLGDAMAAQQRRLAIDVEESALASEREQQIDDAERLRNQQAAQADVSAARERRAQIIERGPSKPAFARTAMAMITEALKPIARPDGTADYGAVVDRLMRETKEQHAREDAAAQLRVQIAGDEVGNIGRARKEEALQSAVVREITARSLRIEVETAAANTQDEFAQARALTIVDDLKRQEAAAQAAQRALAEDKAHKRAMDDAKRRKVEADIRLADAKTGTEGERALKLAADAAKAARGKGGKKESAGLIAANVVNVPGTDSALVTFSDDARGHKEAAAARDIIGEQQSFLESLNSARAFYEDADKQGILGSIGHEGSKANERFTTINGVLQAKMAQIKAGPGKATTASDEEWAKQFVPDSPNAWSSKERGLRKLDAALSVFEDESRSLLGRTTRLDAKTRERVVKQARKRGVSQTQRSRSLASKAQQTALDPKKSTDVRVKAVETLEENARLSASQGGGDWIPQAAAQIVDVTLKTDDPEVENAGFDKITKMQRFLEERIAQRINLLGDRARLAPGMEDDRAQLEKLEADRIKIAEKKFAQAKNLLASE